MKHFQSSFKVLPKHRGHSVCRLWQRPGNRPKTTLHNVTDFNIEVQHDLVTWKGKQVLHLVDVFLIPSCSSHFPYTRHYVSNDSFIPMRRMLRDARNAQNNPKQEKTKHPANHLPITLVRNRIFCEWEPYF